MIFSAGGVVIQIIIGALCAGTVPVHLNQPSEYTGIAKLKKHIEWHMTLFINTNYDESKLAFTVKLQFITLASLSPPLFKTYNCGLL